MSRINEIKQHNHQIVYINTELLNPYPNNPKIHTGKQTAQIAAMMQLVGFINPIIADDGNVIVAGHGRWEAAKSLGLQTVPVIKLSSLTPAEVQAYRLADNQLTMNTGYDDGLLRIELKALTDLSLDFDLEITGFETAAIDLLLEDSQEGKVGEADDVPEVSTAAPVVQRGEVWLLGLHRLACGDARDSASFVALMAGLQADVVFTDPPYNVNIDKHVCGNGKIKHNEFAMASGEMSEAEFMQFLRDSLTLMIANSRDGSLHYIFIDWRHTYELLVVGRSVYHALNNMCIWNKSNGGMGSMYRSKHEMVVVFKNGAAPHMNNIELGKHGRYRTNVWDYPGVNSFGGQKDLAMHPTVKPVALIIDAIKDCTRRGQIVLDPFAGSGSTLIACEKSGRLARCIEYEPKYCDVIIKRWQDLTGHTAVREADGLTFAEVQAAGGRP